jgi:hypothetical protein
MTIVDWDAAFVLDPDPEDVRAVLEFANVQLLEMRWLDLQLDDAIGALTSSWPAVGAGGASYTPA